MTFSDCKMHSNQCGSSLGIERLYSVYAEEEWSSMTINIFLLNVLCLQYHFNAISSLYHYLTSASGHK